MYDLKVRIQVTKPVFEFIVFIQGHKLNDNGNIVSIDWVIEKTHEWWTDNSTAPPMSLISDLWFYLNEKFLEVDALRGVICTEVQVKSSVMEASFVPTEDSWRSGDRL